MINYNPFRQNPPEENVAAVQVERLRGNRALLQNLYRREINPMLHMPPIRGVRIAFIASLTALIGFSAVALTKFNSFIALREDVHAKQGALEAVVQRRRNLFDNLVNLTLNHAMLEHSVFSHVADVRKEILQKMHIPEAQLKTAAAELPLAPPPALLHSQAADGMLGSMGRLLAIVEQYPNIKSATTYHDLMQQLVDIENRIAAKRVELLDTSRLFNTAISNFPWYILAEYTRFSRFEYYQTAPANHVPPEISEKIFKQLLPMTERKIK